MSGRLKIPSRMIMISLMLVNVSAQARHSSNVSFLICVNSISTKIFLGINSETTSDVLKRLDSIIKCEPIFCTLLIGTNDCGHAINDGLSYDDVIKKKIDGPGGFVQNYTEILTRLLHTTSSNIILITIPPYGPHLESVKNKLCRYANQKIKDIVNNMQEDRISMIDFHTILERKIREIPPEKISQNEADINLIYKACASYVFMDCGDWNKVGRRFGFQHFCDGLHFNDATASFLAIEIMKSLQNLVK